MGSLNRMLRSKGIFRRTKMRLYGTVITPTLVHECEA